VFLRQACTDKLLVISLPNALSIIITAHGQCQKAGTHATATCRSAAELLELAVPATRGTQAFVL